MNVDVVVNILGEPWRVKIFSSELDSRLKDNIGFTDWTSHFIGIADPDETESTLDNTMELIKQVARHEIVHAFMFQSGLSDDWKHEQWGHDETVVDWIARQFKAMQKVIEKVEKAIGEAV